MQEFRSLKLSWIGWLTPSCVVGDHFLFLSPTGAQSFSCHSDTFQRYSVFACPNNICTIFQGKSKVSIVK